MRFSKLGRGTAVAFQRRQAPGRPLFNARTPWSAANVGKVGQLGTPVTTDGALFDPSPASAFPVRGGFVESLTRLRPSTEASIPNPCFLSLTPLPACHCLPVQSPGTLHSLSRPSLSTVRPRRPLSSASPSPLTRLASAHRIRVVAANAGGESSTTSLSRADGDEDASSGPHGTPGSALVAFSIELARVGSEPPPPPCRGRRRTRSWTSSATTPASRRRA